jgi:hypothetical protein
MLQIRKILSHLTVIFGGMFLTFFLIDRVNTAMGFIDSEISKWVLFCFSLTAIAQGILSLISIRWQEREK